MSNFSTAFLASNSLNKVVDFINKTRSENEADNMVSDVRFEVTSDKNGSQHYHILILGEKRK